MSVLATEAVSHPLITPELAAAIERSHADLLRSLAEHAGGRIWQRGQACAAYIAPGSPLNQCAAVDLTPEALDDVRAFYADCGCGFEFGVSPFVAQEMFDALAERGWPIIEREQLMILDLADEISEFAPPEGVELRTVEGSGALAVSQAMLEGFFAPNDAPPGMLELFADTADAEGYGQLGAFEDGRAIGGATYAWSGPIGWLRGGSVVESHRSRGVHKALQSRRLELLREKGCQYAIMGALPGSISQLNAQKLGFQVAYTRLSFFCSKG